MGRTRLVPLAVVALVIAGGTAVPQAEAAGGDSMYLFVNNRSGSNCSDTGPGTATTPYCTIGVAAAEVTAGQTVLIAGSQYAEHVTVTKSGTPVNPITFEAWDSSFPGATVVLSGTGAGITVDGQHDVTLASISVSGTGNTGVSLTDSSHLTLRSITQAGDTTDPAGIRLSSVSSSSLTDVKSKNNTYAGLSLDSATSGVVITTATVLVNGRLGQGSPGVAIAGDSNTLTDSSVTGNGIGIAVQAGASDTIIANDTVSQNQTAGIDNADANGTAVTSDVVTANCTGVVVRGSSTSVSVENTIASLNGSRLASCPTPVADRAGIAVYDAATASTTVDYNIVHQPEPGDSLYVWGSPVTSLADFQSISGQGGHDIDADPLLDKSFAPSSNSPALDSADSTARGEQDTDNAGHGAENDPSVQDTGHGPITYRDRGVQELIVAPRAALTLTGAVPTTTTGWQFTADASQSRFPWSPVSTYTFDFGDGTVLTQSAPVAHHSYTQLGTQSVTVTVKDDEGLVDSTTDSAQVGGRYHAVFPTRILDTRSKVGVPTSAPVPAGGTLSLRVAGIAGLPASGATAVVVNVTVTQPTASGYLTVYPDGSPRPGTSNLDWVGGQSTANLVTVPVMNGKIDFYNGSSGTVHILADLAGFYAWDDYNGERYHQNGPVRVLDTRSRVGVATTTAVAPGATVSLPITGVAGVPDSGDVVDVTLNVTVTQPTAVGFLTVYPDGEMRPGTSNLDWAKGQTLANLVTVPVEDGKVNFYNGSSGTVHILADLAGYYDLVRDTLPPNDGGLYESGPLVRVLDTRDGTGTGHIQPIAPGATLVLSLTDYPVHYQTGANNGVLLNVTVTRPTAAGFLTVYPDGPNRPTVSNLDWAKGQTIANLVSIPILANGTVALYNGSSGTVDVIADLVGSFQI